MSTGLAEAPTPVQGGDTLRIPEVFLPRGRAAMPLPLLQLCLLLNISGTSKRKEALSTSTYGVLCQGALRTNDKR